MSYLILKSLHIISVVTWFAGLFYMPRLLVYFAEANQKSEVEKKVLQDQFKIMQRRLWFGITIPSSIAVAILGSSMLHNFIPFTQHPWLILKLFLVVGLYLYQLWVHRIFKQQQQNQILYSPMKLRMINEISTIFLFSIVFLVVVKDVLNMFYGLLGLFALILSLMIGIKAYKKVRQNAGEKIE